MEIYLWNEVFSKKLNQKVFINKVKKIKDFRNYFLDQKLNSAAIFVGFMNSSAKAFKISEIRIFRHL